MITSNRNKKIRKKFLNVIFSLIIVVVIGVTGYMNIEKWNFNDSLYMTIITISTVGFKEILPLSNIGKYFTILLIIFGISIFIQGINVLITIIVNEYFNDVFKRRRLHKMLKKLKNHYIICGCGEVGIETIKELKMNNAIILVIDKNPDLEEMILEIDPNILFINGDASNDEILLRAGIKNAKGIFCTIDNDAQNVFIVLTARELNPDIYIISRYVTPSSKSKILKAGANKIISPNIIGGKRMAEIMMNPDVIDFLDSLIDKNKSNLRLESIKIPENSKLINLSLSEVKIPNRTGCIIVGIKDAFTNNTFFAPSSESLIRPNDSLIILGDNKRIKKIINLLNSSSLYEFDKKNKNELL